MSERENGNANSDGRPVQQVETHLLAYLKGFEELQRVANEVQRYLVSVLDEQAIKYHLVDARAKSYESYKAKSEKTVEGNGLKYQNLPHDIHDCVAARVIVYTTSDRNATVEELRERFDVLHGEDKNPGDARTDRFESGWGYDSHHFVVRGLKEPTSESTALGRYLAEDRLFEVQVRTVAAHAWAEYEHDVRYKPERLDRVSEKDQGFIQGLFKEAASARQSIDSAFSEIEQILNRVPGSVSNKQLAKDPQPVVAESPQALTTSSLKLFLEDSYAEARISKDPAIEWMTGVLKAVGIITVQQLSETLAPVDSVRVAELMDYQTAPTRIRRLDDDLLSALGQTYVEQTAGVADDATAAERRQRYLPARHRRLSGKLLIYEISEGDGSGAEVLHPPATAAGAVRSLVYIVLKRVGVEAAIVNEYVGARAADLSSSDRASLWKFDTGDELWIHGNLSRASAEDAMKQLVDRLEPGVVQVLRAGDVLFERAH